jgi:cell fate regulator YaaT (PSP1 superfamily)
MQECIEVEFRSGRLGYYVNPLEIQISPDDLVILEVERGEDIATVIHMAMSNPEIDVLCESSKLLKIKRVATDEDIDKLNNIIEKEEAATETFLNCVGKYDFEMKLIETIYQFDGNKLTFFFTADGRIDFRQFVRELANIFRTRIELHQTTGRDEAKRLGGFGMCGNKYCCTSYMKRFNQVTIKMAKDQNLAGNLSKISGPCGRLLCCLHFEEDYYVETAKDFPEMGDSVQIKGVTMYVFKNDFYNKKVYLSSDDQVIDTIDLADFARLKEMQKNK